MRHLTKVFILLGLMLIFGSISNVSSQTLALTNNSSILTQDRLVVFEAFMRST
jgi:hypothetical protein